MSNLLKRVLSMVVALVMVIGMIPVTSLAATTEVVFDFGNNGDAEHVDGKDLGTSVEYTSGNYTLALTNMSKVYGPAYDATGISCIKMGTSSAVGTFTFTAPDNVDTVIISAAMYKAKATKLNINGTEYSITTSSNDGAYTDIEIDTSSTKTVTVATASSSYARAMINSITYIAEESGCEHTPVEGSGVETAPTCTAAGYTTYTCATCGEEYTDDVVEANGHTWDAGVVVDPTCTYSGYTLYTCTVDGCGSTNKTDYVDYEGHAYVIDGTSITCENCDLNGTVISVAEAIAVCEATGTTQTTEDYYVVGTVSNVKSDYYGNVYIVDEEGNSLYVYGMYDADGDRYSYMDYKPVVGDTVILEGTLINYNGTTPEMMNSTLVSYTIHECDWIDATFDAPKTCSICGATEGEALVAVAQVGDTDYASLAEAVEAAEEGATVTLLADTTGAGVVIDKSITIDLNGYTYTFNKTVGSTGTTTLGFQILKDNDVVITNGTLTSTAVTEGKEVKVLIQNYANLTLTDVNLVDDTEHILYCLSNNCGNVVLDGTTSITTDAVAFDVYDYSSAGYTLPVVTVADTVVIDGAIEAVAKVGNVYYASLAEAVEAAEEGATVTLLADTTGAGVVIDKSITIDLNGYTYTFNQTVGSAGTTTLGFQILKDNDVVIKNGTLTSIAVTEGKEVKVLIQNYANLTLTDVNLVDNTEHILYCLSNNCGTIELNGNTNITTDAVAFDVFDYSAGGYALPEMVVNTTGTISGNIEVSDTVSLTIYSGSYTVDVNEWCAEGYVATADENGVYTVAACEHTEYAYADNYDGETHTVSCAVCGTVINEAEAHTYGEDDACACGVYKLGSENNPISLQGWRITSGYTHNIAAGETVYFAVYQAYGMDITVNGETHGSCTSMSYVFSITNDGEEAADYVIAAVYPVGSSNNPAELQVNYSNYVEVAEGASEYYFRWVATADGTLTINPYGYDADWNDLGIFYVVNNLTAGTYGDSHYNDGTTETLTVSEGDEIIVVVNSYDAENPYTAPAGDVYVYATFTCTTHAETYVKENWDGYTHCYYCTVCDALVSTEDHVYGENDECVCGAVKPGTENNPIAIYDDYTATIAAGETVYYCAYYLGGTTMTINGADAVAITSYSYKFSITNEGEEAADYEIAFAYPAGSYSNPAELVIGENVSEHAEGDGEYYYTYTATADGTLTLEFSTDAAGWFYCVNNAKADGTYSYGDNQWNDSDPVVNPAVIEVSEGDVLEIVVDTYDPNNMWTAPAGTVTVTASFEAAESGEEEGDDNNGSFEGVTITADGYTYTYTAETAGTLTVSVGDTSTGNWKYKVYYPDGTESSFLNKYSATWFGADCHNHTSDVAGTWKVVIYLTSGGVETDGTASFDITFTPAEGEEEVEKAEYEVDYDHYLALGDNTLTLLETAVTTIYIFEPTEMGVYTFTAPEGAILGYWGGGEWYLVDPASTTNTYEWTCTAVGQSAFIGVSGVEGEFNLNVAKTGEYNPIVYTIVTYENKAELSAFELTDCMTLGDYVDVSAAHEAVLGEDGYYHLDSADGPILLIDMNYEGIVLSDKLYSDIPTMYLNTDEQLEDGTYIKYDLGNAVLAYEAVMSVGEDEENPEGYYPVTEDIILFYNDYATGAQQIWAYYGVEGESAWMYCMRTMTIEHGEYAYTNNGDGTHDYACPVCGDTTIDNEEHTYTDGACVCGALQPVAMIGETTYTSLADALAAAVSGDVVEVIADTADGYLIIAPGVTLDLNGQTVEAQYVIGLNGSYLTADDNSGKLIVAQDNIALSTNGYINENGYYVLPVWNEDHFVFSLFAINTDTAKDRGLTVDEEAEEIYFQFKHQATGAINKSLLADGCSDNELSVIVRLTWTNEQGTASQDFVYNDGFVGEVVGGKDYTFTLTGYTALNIDLDTLVVQAMIVTDSGATAFGAEW